MRLHVWIRSVFRSLFRKSELDRDLDDELHSCLRMLVEEKVRAGMDPGEAARRARIELGGVEQVKERVRDRRLGVALDTLAQDVHYAFRTLRKNAGLTAVAALILAIGIGANTALFSTIHSVLLRGVPFPEPDRLVVGLKTMNGVMNGPVSRVDYFDYREQSRSFANLAALTTFLWQETVIGGLLRRYRRSVFGSPDYPGSDRPGSQTQSRLFNRVGHSSPGHAQSTGIDIG